jgi:hypothetical protein
MLTFPGKVAPRKMRSKCRVQTKSGVVASHDACLTRRWTVLGHIAWRSWGGNVILGNWDSCEPLNSGSRCIHGRLGTWTSSGLLESGSFDVQMSMPEELGKSKCILRTRFCPGRLCCPYHALDVLRILTTGLLPCPPPSVLLGRPISFSCSLHYTSVSRSRRYRSNLLS